MEDLTNSTSVTKALELNESGIKQLSQTRKWTMFLSITGFILLGLMISIALIALAFSANSFTSRGLSALAMLPLLLITIVYFFPIYFLFQFSKASKKAIDNSDPTALTIALKYLKRHYQFMGILIIVVIVIYVVFGMVLAVTGGLRNLY